MIAAASDEQKNSPVPEGPGIIEALSGIYTETLGPGAMGLFLTGSVTALYSTLFVACASSTRMFTDAFAQFGLLEYASPESRRRWIGALAWALPLIWTVLFLYVRAPLFMVSLGGIALAVLLLQVVFAAQQFRYRRLPQALRPSRAYDVLLWASIAAIVCVGLKAVSG